MYSVIFKMELNMDPEKNNPCWHEPLTNLDDVYDKEWAKTFKYNHPNDVKRTQLVTFFLFLLIYWISCIFSVFSAIG